MKLRTILLLILIPFLIMSTLPAGAAAQEEGPVVRAVFFFSPTCPHCHIVINDVFPPLVNEYGERLQILHVDVTQQTGQALYQTAVRTFQIPQQRFGVPTLIVEDVVLVGSEEIPAQFSGLIEQGLSEGGISWPAISGLDRAYPGVVAPAAEGDASTSINATPVDPAAQATTADPVGTVLAALLLLTMLGALGYTALQIKDGRFLNASLPPMRTWSVPALILFGLLIALYLSYVELARAEAICGPIGNCNLVQSSPYAHFLGIPVALLGVANYLALGILWLSQRMLDDGRLRYALLAIVALTVVGTLFSIYLTSLELFVIEAVCPWCLASAAIMTALMVVSVQFVVREAGPLGPSRRRARRLNI